MREARPVGAKVAEVKTTTALDLLRKKEEEQES